MTYGVTVVGLAPGRAFRVTGVEVADGVGDRFEPGEEESAGDEAVRHPAIRPDAPCRLVLTAPHDDGVALVLDVPPAP